MRTHLPRMRLLLLSTPTPLCWCSDLAYIRDGLLYITGRLKDVIIVGGRNLYPQDVEVTVEGVSKEIRPGCSAAFQLQTGLGAGDAGASATLPPDHIGIVAEVRSAKLSDGEAKSLFAAIRQAVTAEHGLTVARIALVKARTIPKTVRLCVCACICAWVPARFRPRLRVGWTAEVHVMGCTCCMFQQHRVFSALAGSVHSALGCSTRVGPF